jgi:ubiquinone biosynthesis protein
VDIPGLALKYRSARRLQQIINVFLKYGFGQIIDQVHLGVYVPFKKRLRAFGAWPAVKGPSAAEGLRKAFAELGPSFIKLAQLLSSRADLITDRFANEFRKLQDEVPPFSVREVRQIMEEDLSEPLEAFFLSFDETPIAAASIAQVHRARLLSGEDVVVKVQRPHIREDIESDISIMSFVARLLEKNVPESRFFNPSGIVEEFSKTVKKELNFVEEARNCARLKKNFEAYPGVHIPKVYEEFSTERVLVLEMIEGVRIDNIAAIDAMGVDKKKLARHGLDVYFKQILEDGFFHGDPHPGNILIKPGGEIAFLDFGIVGRVSVEVKEIIAGTFMALIDKDFEGLVDHYIELGMVADDIDTDSFKREFKSDLVDLLEPLYGLQLQEIQFTQFLDTITRLAIKHNLRIPAELLLINKTLMMLENLCRHLDPRIDVIAAAEPFASKLGLKGMNPFKMYEKARQNAKEISDFVQIFPKQMKKLMKKAVKDDLQIKMYHVNLPEFIKDMDRASNRIAFAMIVSSIILSSAIMHATGVLPTVFGLSFLGLISFVVAFFLGLWLIISIIRSGRL